MITIRTCYRSLLNATTEPTYMQRADINKCPNRRTNPNYTCWRLSSCPVSSLSRRTTMRSIARRRRHLKSLQSLPRPTIKSRISNKQTSKQINKQTSKQTNMQANKQSLMFHIIWHIRQMHYILDSVWKRVQLKCTTNKCPLRRSTIPYE